MKVKWIRRFLGKETDQDLVETIVELKADALECERNMLHAIEYAKENVYSEMLWYRVWDYRDELMMINKKIEELELRLSGKIKGS